MSLRPTPRDLTDLAAHYTDICQFFDQTFVIDDQANGMWIGYLYHHYRAWCRRHQQPYARRRTVVAVLKHLGVHANYEYPELPLVLRNVRVRNRPDTALPFGPDPLLTPTDEVPTNAT